MLRFGLLLSFCAVFLQISVFLQTLLPENFQISPVCETISLALTQGMQHAHSHTSSTPPHQEKKIQSEHQAHDTHAHHDPSHQCQYCTVYANVVLPPEHDIHEILVNIRVQFIWLQQQFERVYFALQRLFLLPQGRAPPVFI